jgi:predicted RNA-binding protein YlqC (UPF0109 family)
MTERKPRPEDEMICHLVTEIAKAVSDEVENVHVELQEEADVITLRLHVADSDIGKVIGKQGRTARSLRTIISAASMKFKRRYALDIPHHQPRNAS